MTEIASIRSWSDVPAFASEAEEADYWATNGPDERLLETFGRPYADLDACPECGAHRWTEGSCETVRCGECNRVAWRMDVFSWGAFRRRQAETASGGAN